MSTNNEWDQFYQGGGQPPVNKPKGISKTAWILIASCLSLLVIGLILGVAAFFIFWPWGGDPIAAITPKDTAIYASFDLLNARSDNLDDYVALIKEISGETDNKNLIETADSWMKDNYDLTFTDDVAPWIGRYGSIAVSGLDSSSSSPNILLIFQARDTSKADTFVRDLVRGAQNEKGMKFDTRTVNGITFYENKPSYGDDTIIARAGNYVFISNSEDAILESTRLDKSDSLAESQAYKDTLAALPGNRLATLYLSSDTLLSDTSGILKELYHGAPSLDQASLQGMQGAAVSMGVEKAGLRFDVAASYDPQKISSFQKESFQIQYLRPKADTLVSADTFFFMDLNSSQSAARYLESDSPIYTQDFKEALDLFEQEYGVDLRELFNLSGGEYALAMGPARDGLLPENANFNAGLTFLASTTDERRSNQWFNDVIDTTARKSDVPFDTRDVTLGEFNLQELTVRDSGKTITAGYFGADNGYMVLGTSRDMLTNGLSGRDSLASDSTYRTTWSAFPSGSIPYVYINVSGLLDCIESSSNVSLRHELGNAYDGLKKIQVVAMAINKPVRYSQSFSLMILIDTSN